VVLIRIAGRKCSEMKKKQITREQALKVWRLMTSEEREDLWKENCKSDHFSNKWPFVAFAMSTSVMWQAMQRRFEKGEGLFDLS